MFAPVSIGDFLTALIAWLLGELVPLTVFFAAAFYVLSLPLRRDEQTRVLLDLLEHGLKAGQSPEVALAGAAAGDDHSLGPKFRQLAALVQGGMRLEEACRQVPRLLPAQVQALLKVGQDIGDLPRVLPACRSLLGDAVSRTRSAVNYLPILWLFLIPAQVLLLAYLQIWIWPKLVQITMDMEIDLPGFSSFVLRNGAWFSVVLAALVAVFWGALLLYAGGPNTLSRLGPAAQAWRDRAIWCLPWRRHRLHRDFTTVLALLLDLGIPEHQAIGLAAESTVNSVLIQRAKAAIANLRKGIKLPEALAILDDTRQFRWRLANASYRASGFWDALAGWREALDAKAYQQEQSAAQILTTAFVLLNGVVVAITASAVFLVLTSIIEGGLLW